MESNLVGLLCSQARRNGSINNCLMNTWPDTHMVLKLRREIWAEGIDDRESLATSVGSHGAG